MPSTFFGLSIGKTGLNAAQIGWNTTAHNSSNINTKGYSRQVASFEAGTPVSVYSRAGMAGTGVSLIGVERQRNIYYDEKYRISNAAYGNYNTKEYYMTSVQNYFKETDKDTQGLTGYFTNLYNAFEDLQKNGADSTKRTAAIESADNLADFVNYLGTSLQSVQKEANADIKTTAERINSIASQVATLNKQINTLEQQGGVANDLRDQRDRLIDELSEYGNISVTETNRGDDKSVLNEFTIKLDNKTLVDTYKYNQLIVSSVDGKVNQNDIDGLYTLSWKDGQDFDSSSPTLGGKLQALFEIRDGNNKTAFTGQADINTNIGDDFVVVKGTNCNDANKLNIPAEKGTIMIGAKQYYYSSFSVEIDDATGEYTYTFEGLYDDAGNKEITQNVAGKQISIGASIDYKGVPYYQAQLNEFVRTYATSFNKIHNAAEDLSGQKGMDFFNGKSAVSGKNYELYEKVDSFTSSGTASYTDEDGTIIDTGTSYYNVTALNFCVTDEIKDNVMKFALASDIDKGVDCVDMLDQIIAGKTDKSMFKQGTPMEFLSTFTANIGIDTQQASLFATSQSNISKAIDEQRMSISSVDSDEEAMNMVKYQSAYELSAKMISTMSQIYDVLLNM